MAKLTLIKYRLGFEVGTGAEVVVPLAHTFVTGQSQLSGKTTTLRAIVERVDRRALAFITKRGESLDGRRIRPYLPREGEQPIHWRFVETIMASALEQRALKYERLQIIAAAKDARSLADVRRNITRLQEKAKGPSADIYTLLGEYLDLVLPEMKALRASDVLDLQPGINVMDLTDASPRLQALVMRAALERINQHETGVLTVFPEAWEFAPRDRNAAAKTEAEHMARKGAVLGNFLLCDSQDIAGVSPVVRQAASVWIVGAQAEANERKRTLEVIKSRGVAAPKPADVATLPIGYFYVCQGTRAIKTYVQPIWMSDDEARAVALSGDVPPASPEPKAAPASAIAPARYPLNQPPANDESEIDMDMLKQVNDKLDKLLAGQTDGPAETSPAGAVTATDVEALYQHFKARLLAEPAVLRVLAEKPELQIAVEKKTIVVDGSQLVGRVALLIRRGWLDTAKTNSEIVNELGRTGGKTIAPRVSEALAKLKGLGFVTDEGNGWRAVADMKRSIVDKK